MKTKAYWHKVNGMEHHLFRLQDNLLIGMVIWTIKDGMGAWESHQFTTSGPRTTYHMSCVDAAMSTSKRCDIEIVPRSMVVSK